MAWQQVELLLVLTGFVLLVLVRGWERVNESQLIQFYETGQWSDPDSFNADDYYDYEEEILKKAINFAANQTSPVDAFPTFDRLKPVHLFTTDKDLDYDDYKDQPPDEEVEGFATSEVANPHSDHMEERDSSRNKWPNVKESEFHVEFVAPLPKSWVGCSHSASEETDVVCTDDGFRITLPSGQLSSIQVVGWKNISVADAPKSCGYHTNHLKNVLTVDFTGCNVREDEEDIYSLQLSFRVSGRHQELTAFCVESAKFDSGLLPRTFGKHTRCDKPINPPPATADPKPSRCPLRTIKGPLTTGKPVTAAPKSWLFTTRPPHTTGKPETSPPAKEMSRSATSQKRHNCAVHVEERIPCGHFGTSRSDCERKGCCVDPSKHGCYYPLDECTADQHAVFAIRHDCAAIPVDPRKLSVTGGPLCRPAIVNDKVAVFNIRLEDCGVHSYEVGDMKIYMIEVQNVVKALNLKYGIITRDDPLRFLIECRYMKDGGAVADQAVASIGYMVKTSTSNLPSSIISSGRYSVELRIAKDRTYSSYYPTYHQPLKLLLGHPVYLELRLRSAKPDAVLLVNYCLAYPRSAKNALVIIHEGCANPNDPTVSILKVSDSPQNRHLRRFRVEAFQFMDQRTNLYLNEEIYFMCSTEVCMTLEKPCVERCFDGKGPKSLVKRG
ncbi:zona pellucida sperm-binding protein 1 isoform X1 [Fundulus heteroclitus]|uniref:zona pellucida sperm-binding protein 1 isoform X1 n=1 Tax=Fundulus heteroclitus TaxID=8078 RepID=UPI00165A3955|nr:zona pellucida sperm-binding protein 1 isoform X1 [Fundulus heteroclitus]